MIKQGWTSINALVVMAIDYLHHGKLSMVCENLRLAKEALDELVAMENSQMDRDSEIHSNS